MGRIKAADDARRDNRGRILPKGVTFRSKQQDYMWRMTYKGISYPPVYEKDLGAMKRRLPSLIAEIYSKSTDGSGGLRVITLNECFKHMIKEKEDISDITRVNYKKYWMKHVEGSLGMKSADKITKEMIRKKYKKLMDEDGAGLAWGTVKYIHALLFSAFEWGIDNNRYRGKNPAKNALKGIEHDESEGERPLTTEEETIFFDFVDNHKHFKYHSALLHTLRELGLRAGEGIGLCKDVLHFEDGFISIERSLSYKDNVGDGKRRKYFSTTKTECSIRTLPVLDYVQETIERYLTMREMIGRECIESVEGRSDFVFITQMGTPYTVDYLNQLIHRIINSYNKKEEEKAKEEKREPVLLEQFSSHAFRHTFGQYLKNEGVDDETIKDWMGHADTRTTLIYAKPNWLNLEKKMPDCLKNRKAS